MEWFVRAFLKASLSWLVLGSTLGAAMAVHPVWTIYRPAHVHMMLLGFVTLMIFGIAYHVVPRFAGHPLHSRRAAGVHWWTSNVGLACMVVGFVLRARGLAPGTGILAIGGTLSTVGAYLFAVLMWRTIDGPAELRAAGRRARDTVEGRLGQRAPLPMAGG